MRLQSSSHTHQATLMKLLKLLLKIYINCSSWRMWITSEVYSCVFWKIGLTTNHAKSYLKTPRLDTYMLNLFGKNIFGLFLEHRKINVLTTLADTRHLGAVFESRQRNSGFLLLSFYIWVQKTTKQNITNSSYVTVNWNKNRLSMAQHNNLQSLSLAVSLRLWMTLQVY